MISLADDLPEKVLAQKENLLLLDDWRAMFWSPDLHISFINSTMDSELRLMVNQRPTQVDSYPGSPLLV